MTINKFRAPRWCAKCDEEVVFNLDTGYCKRCHENYLAQVKAREQARKNVDHSSRCYPERSHRFVKDNDDGKIHGDPVDWMNGRPKGSHW